MNSFDLKDFTPADRTFLKARVDAEAEKIYASKQPTDKRTVKQIWDTNCYGQAAEVNLIRNHGFTDNPAPYQDVMWGDIPVEVKVTKSARNITHVLERMNAKKRWKDDNPNWVFVYTNDRTQPGTEYKLLGTYLWSNYNDAYISANFIYRASLGQSV